MGGCSEFQFAPTFARINSFQKQRIFRIKYSDEKEIFRQAKIYGNLPRSQGVDLLK